MQCLFSALIKVMVRAQSSINATFIRFPLYLYILLLNASEACWDGRALRYIIMLVCCVLVQKVQMGLEIIQAKLSDALPKSNHTFILFLRVRLCPVNIFLK
jgi:hypothetical protein